MIIQFPSDRQRAARQPQREEQSTTEISSDAPLRLDVAAEIAFPFGGMTASGLRREAKRGRLVIERIAGKDYTTLRYIEEMRQQCRNELTAKAHDFGCNQSAKKKVAAPGNPHGSSAMMVRYLSALAALEKTAQALNENCKTTLPANTKSRVNGAVIQNKS